VADFGYTKIIATVVVAVLGWLVAHYFTAKRDVASKRRELRLKYLIDAYQVLTNEISHRQPNNERTQLLENLLSDIQLYGSLQQVELAKTLADDASTGGDFELDPLINCLRDDLRDELNLCKIPDNVKWLRLNK
jgi:hypothetical protein